MVAAEFDKIARPLSATNCSPRMNDDKSTLYNEVLFTLPAGAALSRPNLGCHWLCQCSSLWADQGKHQNQHWPSQRTQSQKPR